MPNKENTQLVDLLQRIQHLMQNHFSVEKKLENMMREIAVFFGADSVCSYISVDENYLTLFSEYGHLKMTNNTIRLNEGIIGEVAQTARWRLFVNQHTQLKTIVGLPLIQWDFVLGVIALGYQKEHHMTDSEIEKLKTLSMFMVTIFSLEEIATYKKRVIKMSGFSLKDAIKGIAANKGFGLGYAIIHSRSRELTQIFSNDIDSEQKRLSQARCQMIENLSYTLENNTFSDVMKEPAIHNVISNLLVSFANSLTILFKLSISSVSTSAIET